MAMSKTCEKFFLRVVKDGTFFRPFSRDVSEDAIRQLRMVLWVDFEVLFIVFSISKQRIYLNTRGRNKSITLGDWKKPPHFKTSGNYVT